MLESDHVQDEAHERNVPKPREVYLQEHLRELEDLFRREHELFEISSLHFELLLCDPFTPESLKGGRSITAHDRDLQHSCWIQNLRKCDLRSERDYSCVGDLDLELRLRLLQIFVSNSVVFF